MTVLDNVKVAFHCRQHGRPRRGDAPHAGPTRSRKGGSIAESRELLKIFDLDHLAEEQAQNLPYGSQRRLEIARALATAPRLLLLDEPAAGMNPQETNELMDLIRWIRDEFGLAVLLVEHDMQVVMGICETRARARLRLDDRRGPARRDSERSEGDRGLSGGSVTGAGAAPMLEVSDLVVSYGAIKALNGISIRLMPDEIVTLIGANGAGKSTTLRAIVGLVAPACGRDPIPTAGRRGRTPTYQLVRRG